MAAKDELGRRGEKLATEYLQDRGLKILARNWRCPEGELDIVATDGDSTVIFCEVKTRSGTGFGTPVEAVTRGKRRRIRRLSYIWITSQPLNYWKTRQFDVIGVLIRPGAAPELRHIRSAF